MERRQRAPEGGAARMPGDALRVLVVEDDEITARGLVRTLSRRGCAVTHAANGEEARRHLRESAFDVAIADYSLGPGETGLETLTWARGEIPGVALILISGTYQPRNDDLRTWFTFLAKPFQPDQLFNLIITLTREPHGC
jgi:DNA-binding NtrC family response regulator